MNVSAIEQDAAICKLFWVLVDLNLCSYQDFNKYIAPSYARNSYRTRVVRKMLNDETVLIQSIHHLTLVLVELGVADFYYVINYLSYGYDIRTYIERVNERLKHG